MSLSTYRKALRLGLKDRKSAGSDTLATLDENNLTAPTANRWACLISQWT